MKRRILTLALAVLFALTLVPLVGGTAVAAAPGGLEKVELPALNLNSGANNNDTQMGWATEGFEDEDTEMDVEASVAFRAMFLALEMPAAPHFLQFILQTPAGWWQQSEYGEDDLEGFWDDDEGVLRLPFTGDWDMDDIRCKFLLGYYDDGPMDLGITNQWLEVYPEVEEGDLFEIRLPDPNSNANNNDTQMGWATNGFEDEDTPMDVPAPIALRATHLVLEMPAAPHFLQFILQTPAGWWQQSEYGEDELADFWDDDKGVLNLPFTGDWEASDVRAKFLLGYYDDGVMDLGITGAWLLIGPEVTLGESEPPREIPSEIGKLPFDMGLGGMIWGNEVTQLGWNGDQRAVDNKLPFAGEGGLKAGTIVDANFFAIYVSNAPDDEEAEMLKLTIFGDANGWSWEGGTMEAPTVMIYNAEAGRIEFPIAGHPYVDAIKAKVAEDGDDYLGNSNFGLSFEYEGGIATLGITKVMLYAELPSDVTATPAPPVDTSPSPTPESKEPSSGFLGLDLWVWLVIGGGVVAIIVVIVIVAKKKK